MVVCHPASSLFHYLPGITLPPLVFWGAAVPGWVSTLSPLIQNVHSTKTVSESLAEWKLIVSPWVLGTIEYGYRIPLKYSLPRFKGVLPTTMKPERVPLIMLELVSPGQRGHRAYSPPSERLRILQTVIFGAKTLNIRLLNYTLLTYRFMILTLKLIISQIQSND